MSCCGGDLSATCASEFASGDAFLRIEELMHSGRTLADGSRQYVLSVPSVHCAHCIAAIEKGLKGEPSVADARVNLTTRRVSVTLRSEDTSPGFLLGALERLGYPATPVDLGDLKELREDRTTGDLLKAMAVAGFAAGNIMLLSVSVWAGADGPTRDLFHLISALIAIPTVAYSGQHFFRSAASALSRGRTNMDVPISLAILLGLGMSLFETLRHGENAYFDASVTLLFFLLTGRYLDHLMRDRARAAVSRLANLSARGCMVVGADGTTRFVPIDEVERGAEIIVPAGERVPVDGVVIDGASEMDRAIVTGESAPVAARPGSRVEAGALNLVAPVRMRATAPASESFLAEMVRMMEEAEASRAGYVALADRIASWYAPVVHVLALAAFAGWMFMTGDWHLSLMTAIAVLIITCPCALGLAVPIVQVVGSGVLLERGILTRNGSAFERMAQVDAAVFDKTGTLTEGRPALLDISETDPACLAVAAGLALSSRHPASRAIVEGAKKLGVVPARLIAVKEQAGDGLEGLDGSGRRVRLGRPSWASEILGNSASGDEYSGVLLAIEGEPPVFLAMVDELRPDAARAVESLAEAGLGVEILSGDHRRQVEAVATRLGIEAANAIADARPADKIAHVRDLAAAGLKVLVVGDGLNDAPALAAGHVSMAPGSASDIGKLASDFVFLGESLMAVPETLLISRRIVSFIRQNFAFALAYNLVAIPLAVTGHVTPLVAAIAMSSSSLVVVANALRLRLGRGFGRGFGRGLRAERPQPSVRTREVNA
jgi:P-type Cu2+ transporter